MQLQLPLSLLWLPPFPPSNKKCSGSCDGNRDRSIGNDESESCDNNNGQGNIKRNDVSGCGKNDGGGSVIDAEVRPNVVTAVVKIYGNNQDEISHGNRDEMEIKYRLKWEYEVSVKLSVKGNFEKVAMQLWKLVIFLFICIPMGCVKIPPFYIGFYSDVKADQCLSPKKVTSKSKFLCDISKNITKKTSLDRH